MKDWEVQSVQMQMTLKELRAWLYGIANINSDLMVSYGVDKIKEIENMLRVFTPTGLLNAKE